MTKEQTQEAIKVMQAWCDGKTIQFKEQGAAIWQDREFLIWDWSENDYRVKPEPREFWIRKCNDGRVNHVFTEPVKSCPDHPSEVIHVREVVEGE